MESDIFYYSLGILAIIVICIVSILSRYKLEHFFTSTRALNTLNTTIDFPTKSYVEQIVNDSGYFYRMNKLDLTVRNVNSQQSYMTLYLSNIQEFSQKEKALLTKLVRKAEQYTQSFTLFHNIPWKFVKIHQSIENGWPHTLGDVIVLSNRFFTEQTFEEQINTIIHEKVHVFQRLYPLFTHQLISSTGWGLEVKTTLESVSNARNNPDINNFVYGPKGTSKYFAQVYKSQSPHSLSDSTITVFSKDAPISISSPREMPMPTPIDASQYEHPYEIMATILPNILMKTVKEPKHSLIQSTILWIQTIQNTK